MLQWPSQAYILIHVESVGRTSINKSFAITMPLIKLYRTLLLHLSYWMGCAFSFTLDWNQCILKTSSMMWPSCDVALLHLLETGLDKPDITAKRVIDTLAGYTVNNGIGAALLEKLCDDMVFKITHIVFLYCILKIPNNMPTLLLYLWISTEWWLVISHYKVLIMLHTGLLCF